jgi:GT2 family glycosyltransferase
VVVDNNSSDGSIEAIKKQFPKVELIESKENMGYVGGNNLALKRITDSEYVLILNSDTLVEEKSLDILMNFAKENNYKIAALKTVSKDRKFMPNGGELPTFFKMFLWISGLDDIIASFNPQFASFHPKSVEYFKNTKEIGWAQGAVLLVHTSVFARIGYFDSKIFMYAEDVDLCWRAKKAGIKIGWTDAAAIIHFGGASSAKAHLAQWRGEFRGLLYLYTKYYGALAAFLLRGLIYLFSILRMIAFILLGKGETAKTYGQILISL